MALIPRSIPGPGTRVVVWGFGTHGGGQAAARTCRQLGADVTILDSKPAASFGAAAEGWSWEVGDGSSPALQACDLIIPSPAIPPRAWPASHPPRLSPEALFFALHQGPRVIVTGTKGKSTTARILGCLLGWEVGGNSYDPLLDLLERQGPTAGVVCELSSFQGWYLRPDAPSCGGAVLTTLAVDHLDWHPDLADYHAAKLALLADAPFVATDPGLWNRLPPGSQALAPAHWHPDLAQRDDLALLGDHNDRNAALAVALALQLGVAPGSVAARLRQVQPLPHRLQTVPGQGPWTYVDDSIATTPEAAMAALAAIPGPMAIILGGHDKGASFAELAGAVARRGAIPLLIGTTAPRLAEALCHHGVAPVMAGRLDIAMAAGRSALPEGGTILLSPACSSFDQFRGFEDRGRQFQGFATLTKGLSGA